MPTIRPSFVTINRTLSLTPNCAAHAKITPSPFLPTTAEHSVCAAKIQARTKQLARHLSASSKHHYQQTLPLKTTIDNMAPSQYGIRSVGAPHTLEHRTYIEKDGVPVSPFHDIPLYANEQQTVLNMIVEIPRWTNAKQEVSECHVNAMCAHLHE